MNSRPWQVYKNKTEWKNETRGRKNKHFVYKNRLGVIQIVRSLKFSDFVPPPPYVPHCSFCLHPHPFVNVRFRLFPPPSLYRNFWWLGDEFANFLYRNDTKTNFVFGQYPPPHLTLLVFVRFFAPSPSPSGRTYYLNDPLVGILKTSSHCRIM